MGRILDSLPSWMFPLCCYIPLNQFYCLLYKFLSLPFCHCGFSHLIGFVLSHQLHCNFHSSLERSFFTFWDSTYHFFFECSILFSTVVIFTFILSIFFSCVRFLLGKVSSSNIPSLHEEMSYIDQYLHFSEIPRISAGISTSPEDWTESVSKSNSVVWYLF